MTTKTRRRLLKAIKIAELIWELIKLLLVAAMVVVLVWILISWAEIGLHDPAKAADYWDYNFFIKMSEFAQKYGHCTWCQY